MSTHDYSQMKSSPTIQNSKYATDNGEKLFKTMFVNKYIFRKLENLIYFVQKIIQVKLS